MSETGNYVVLDLETQKGFNEIDRKKLHLLKVSVACIYDSASDSYLAFEEKELMKLEPYLKNADLVVGFNIRDFDFEVLQPYMLTSLRTLPILDILVEFEKARGHRISLQSVAQATLQSSKSGSGWDAIQHFKDGRMDELKKYCLDDVRITKDVYQYGLKHGMIRFISNRDYQTYEVPMNWSNTLKEIKEQKKEENVFPTSLF